MTRQRPDIRRALAVLAVIFAMLPMTACQIAGVTLEIPDFDSAGVTGLQFWKLDLVTGDYRTSHRIEFGQTLSQNGGETLLYSVWKGDKRIAPTIAAVIERGAGEAVTLRVLLPSLATGLYRVSSFNGAGNSELSQGYFTF